MNDMRNMSFESFHLINPLVGKRSHAILLLVAAEKEGRYVILLLDFFVLYLPYADCGVKVNPGIHLEDGCIS